MNWLLMLEDVGVSSSPAITLVVNVLIQSSILIGLGLLLARLFRSRGAAFESALLRATLMTVILCPLVALVLNTAGVHTLSIYLPQPMASVPDQFETVAPSISAGAGVSEVIPIDKGNLSETASEVSVIDTGDEGNLSETASEVSVIDTDAETATAIMSSEIPESAAFEQYESSDSNVLAAEYSLLAVVYGALVIVWLVVSIYLASRLFLFYVRLLYIRRSAFEAASETTAVWREIAEYLNVPMPRILVNDSIVSPCVAGILRPVVLLPQEGESPTVASREVILHELAHLARGDCLWIMLSKLVSAVLFFQPLAWVLGRSNLRAAEDVCDDYVVRYSSDRQSYAHQLVDIAERYQPSGCEAYAAVGLISFRSALGRRVMRIMDTGAGSLRGLGSGLSLW